MQVLEFAVRQQKIFCESERGVIEKSQGLVYASFDFDEEWDGCSIAVLFSNENVDGDPRLVVWTGTPIEIPHELLVQGRLKVSCEGKRNGYSIPTYEMKPGIMVYASGDLIGVVPDNITPSMVEQLMEAAAEARAAKEEILAAKEAGEFNGERGEPGMTMVYDGETGMLIVTTAENEGEGSAGNGENADCVGVKKVEQTVTSTEDGGVNEWTMTLTDGTTAVLQVRNGSKGAKGDKGDKGNAGIGIATIRYDSDSRKWYWVDDFFLNEKQFDGPTIYTCDEIDTMLGSYVNDIAEIVGGDA